jgi:hypothetical protein
MLLFLPLRQGLPRAFDLADHLGMAAQAAEQLREGTFYPRWMGDFNGGLGEPTLVFYPPGLPLAVATLSFPLSGDLPIALFALLILAAFVGGWGVYRLAEPIAGRTGGVVAALAFALGPFRWFQIWQSGLYSAFLAGAFVPWLLLALWKLLGGEPRDEERRRWLFRFPLLFALVVLSNLPAAVLVVHLAVAALLADLAVRRRLRPVLEVIAGGGVGCALAAFYLLPAVVEQPSIESLLPDLWKTQFVFQGEGSAMPPGHASAFARMAAYPALAFVLALVLLAVAAKRGRWEEGDSRSAWLRLIAVWGGAAFFLASAPSLPLWKLSPALQKVNIPWRFLEGVGLAAALACGAAFAIAIRKGDVPAWGRLLGVVGIPLVLLLLFAFDREIARVNGRMPVAEARVRMREFRAKRMYFLPPGVLRPEQLATVPPITADHPCAIEPMRWGLAVRRFRVLSDGPVSLALRTYFFPGWQAVRRLADGGGEPLETLAEPRSGRIVVRVPKGSSDVEIAFGSTPPRRLGIAVSGVAIGLLAAGWFLVARARRSC